MVNITMTMVHLNRLDELKRNIEHHSPYVDRIVISDGGSTDGSLDWLADFSSREKKLEVIVKKQYRLPYGDHTPDARNPYLQALRPDRDNWMLCVDCDEFLEEEACQKLHYFAERAEEAGYNEVRFQARDIWTYETGEVTDNLAETYWKQDMFVKVVPDMSYVGHCFSADTELLTPQGWIRYKDLVKGILVATLNPSSKKIEFQEIKDVFVYNNYTELVSLKTLKGIDLLVTTDHGLISERAPGDSLSYTKAIDTDFLTHFIVSGECDRSDNRDWSDDEIRLWVQCITDGALERPGYWRWHLKKKRKIKRLTELLERMGIDYRVSPPSRKNTFKVRVFDLPEKFSKIIDNRILRSFSAHQATVFLKEWSVTDGTTWNDKSVQLCTSVRETADILQEIAVTSGHQACLSYRQNRHHGIIYTICIRFGRRIIRCKTYNRGLVPYSGDVFCVSVGNGTLLARRNGKVTFTQNTHSGLYRPGTTPRFAKAQGTGSRFLHYRHEKTERMMIRNSSYLYWTTCGNAQNRTDSPVWLEFHKMMSKHGFEDWHEFNKAMEKGNLSDEIKDWMIEHKDAENPEEQAYFLWYFIWLHPEENINKISSERHSRYTWDYVIKANL